MHSTWGTGSPYNMHGSSELLTASRQPDQNDISAIDMVNDDWQDMANEQATSERSRSLPVSDNLDTPSSVHDDAAVEQHDRLGGPFRYIYGEGFPPFEISGDGLGAEAVPYHRHPSDTAHHSPSSTAAANHDWTHWIDWQNTAPTTAWDYVPTTNDHGQTETNTSDPSARETTVGSLPHSGFDPNVQPEPYRPDLIIPQPVQDVPNPFKPAYLPDFEQHPLPCTNTDVPFSPPLSSGDVNREADCVIDTSVPFNGGGEAGRHSLQSTTPAPQAAAQSSILVGLDHSATANPPGSRKRASSTLQNIPSKKPKIARQGSKGSQGVKFEDDLHPDEDADGPLRFTAMFTSAAKAREYIAQPPPEEMSKVIMPNDELKEVLNAHQQLGGHIMEAILDENFEPAPETWTDAARAYFESSQRTAMEVIKRETKTKQDHKRAIAHVYILLDEIISVNRRGIPKKVLREVNEKRGHIPELRLSTMKRVRTVIDVIRKNKTIAKQVVRGESLAELARSPVGVDKSKRGNAALNAKRAAQSKAKGKKGKKVKKKKCEAEIKNENAERETEGGMTNEGQDDDKAS